MQSSSSALATIPNDGMQQLPSSSGDGYSLFLDTDEAKEEEKPGLLKIIQAMPRDYRVWVLASFLAFFNAIYETSSIVVAEKDQEASDDSFTAKSHIESSPERIIVGCLYFIYSVRLNAPGIYVGIQAIRAINHEGLDLINPFRDGNCLSKKNKLYLSLAFCIGIGSFASVADAIGCDYFVMLAASDENQNFAALKSLSVANAGIVAFTIFFTESPELFASIIGQEISEESDNYISHQLLRYFSNAIGGFLRYVGFVEVAIETYVAMVALFGAEMDEVKWFILFLGCIRSASDFFFFGKRTVYASDAFFKKISEDRHTIRAQEVIAFMISLSFVLMIADALRDLYRDFLIEPDTALPFSYGNWFAELIGDCTALREGVVQLYELYDPVLYLVDKTSDGIAYCRSKCSPNLEDNIGVELSVSSVSSRPIMSSLSQQLAEALPPIRSDEQEEEEEDEDYSFRPTPKKEKGFGATCLSIFCCRKNKPAKQDEHGFYQARHRRNSSQ